LELGEPPGFPQSPSTGPLTRTGRFTAGNIYSLFPDP
jgi:hypothetical protein